MGSNMGDRAANCRSGMAALTRSGETRILARSPIYLTEPVDYQDQAWFINGVIKVETQLGQLHLLKALKVAEKEAGRTNGGIRFGPRILDMDILLYDDRVLHTSELEIPHPRMHKRRFVLRPLCDIEPGIIHPVLKKDMQTLLDGLDDPGQKVEPYACDC